MFALQTWTMVSEQKELLYAIRIFRVDEDGEDRRAESFEVLVRVVEPLRAWRRVRLAADDTETTSNGVRAFPHTISSL